MTPQEEFERSRKVLPGDSGRSDRKPGYRVQHRDDGRTGVIVCVVDGQAPSVSYTVRWDDGQTETNVLPARLEDVF